MDENIVDLDRAHHADPENEAFEIKLLSARRRLEILDFSGSVRLAFLNERSHGRFAGPGGWKVFSRLWRRLSRFAYLFELERSEKAKVQRVNRNGAAIAIYETLDGRFRIMGRGRRWLLQVIGDPICTTHKTFDEARAGLITMID